MSRSKKKGEYIDSILWESIIKEFKSIKHKEEKDLGKKEEVELSAKNIEGRLKPIEIVIKTSARRTTIIPGLIGITMIIHNGKEYKRIKITKEMVGHKLGEYSETKRTAKYKKGIKKVK